ncbi:uncharacterized protein LOC121727982 [Aricia agestis]|uniref:uncharacterized protein LOC121727982 n=1 Tax=Aricia agestis TaxID=91739 RepID=UPI001C205957|nr:uncharacterized protein LOC121727982 [Aricia agestis]
MHNDLMSSHDSLEHLCLNNNSSSKTLGIGWLNMSDEFYFNTLYDFDSNSQVITKRYILSHISQIFDPLGLISPCIMQAKIILQRLWLLKIDWNDPVPIDVIAIWNRFVSSLSVLNNIRVPRCVLGDSSNYTTIELHIFTDASQLAYGACIYVRTISDNSNISVRLLCAKGKVAPLKPVSIPRLELCGALLGARLYDKVISSIHRKFDCVVFWTDSTIVLGWLRMSPNLLQTFVQNRVAEIHELSGVLPWHHVSGKHNPADLVSRGVTVDELAKSRLYWSGPEFLHDKHFISTNISHPPHVSPELLPETKRSCHLSFIATNTIFINFERFSNFLRMVRAIAYMLRFLHNVRNKNNKRTDILSTNEIIESQNLLAKISQLESFPVEYNLYIKENKVKDNHYLSKLNIFMDRDKILRVGGRLTNSNSFSYTKKHPILLGSNHSFTKLLFRYEHVKLLHAGPQALLFNIRDNWWPIGGRNLARKVVHECI